jgi:hypothetical protein
MSIKAEASGSEITFQTGEFIAFPARNARIFSTVTAFRRATASTLLKARWRGEDDVHSLEDGVAEH